MTTMNRIEINVQTGEQVVVPLSAEEVAEIQSRPVQAPPPPVDPVEKLRAFLGANPDIAALLK